VTDRSERVGSHRQRPIRGRDPADEQLERVQRANRDPRLQYEPEPTSVPKEAGVDSGIIEHHFRG
jgi:hypothetical protein